MSDSTGKASASASGLDAAVSRLSLGNGGRNLQNLALSSRSVHADDHISSHRAIAPALHVSTTFDYSRNPDELRPWDNRDVCHSFFRFPPLFS